MYRASADSGPRRRSGRDPGPLPGPSNGLGRPRCAPTYVQVPVSTVVDGDGTTTTIAPEAVPGVFPAELTDQL